MEPRIRSIDVAQHVGERVCVRGWLHTVRKLGGITFLVVRDGWGTIQCVCETEECLRTLGQSGALPESIVCVEGIAAAVAQAPGGVELHKPLLLVEEAVVDVLPVVLNKRELTATIPTLLDHGVVANRHLRQRAVFRMGATAMQAFRAALTARHFTEVQTPKIVASATEGGANVFKLDYFGRPAYLAQSPQFYKQIMVGVFERVFEVGPVFRAEPHDTTRHINEYVSLDVEFGFIENHFTVMELLRDVLAEIMDALVAERSVELELLGVTVPAVPMPIPHIHFADAQQWIYSTFGLDVRGEPDLSPQDERLLGEWAKRELGSDFLYVTGYPMGKRPFYTHPDMARPGYSNSFDLLFRGLELVTGGQRLHRFADYVAALEQRGLSQEPFEAYLEAFRFGMPPHGGFAVGLERLLMQLTGAPNLRQTTLFPRDINRLAP